LIDSFATKATVDPGRVAAFAFCPVGRQTGNCQWCAAENCAKNKFHPFAPFHRKNLTPTLLMCSKLTMDKLRDNDTIGKIQQDQIISDFRIRSIERSKEAPWSYAVFGVNEIHKIKNGTEVTDRIVGQYNLRLVEDRRTELNPSASLSRTTPNSRWSANGTTVFCNAVNSINER
jgi:hypothetical protein